MTANAETAVGGLDADRSTRRAWWRDAVIYQIYVRSFADGDGDGQGDLPGIRSRLAYLRELGVDAVWITPFYRSPLADGGYDVADYRDVDPRFGTLDDARALILDAHADGVKVIVDIVPNHTSDEHAWFQEALAAPRGSAARERYLFRDGRGEDGDLPPNDWESVFGGPAWTRVPDPDGTPGQWYLHLFAPAQPDLNWEQAEVRAEFLDILRFWLDLGVDGFRVDVAHGMVKAPGLPDIGHRGHAELIGTAELPFFDQDGVHEIYREWRRLLDEYSAETPRIGVAEAWAPSPQRLANYVRPDELHQAFNFHYLTCEWKAEELRQVITASLDTTGSVGAPTTWVLSNHDVTRHVTRYGGGETGLRRARAAALLTLALPGSVYIYQGDELGLEEVTLPDEALQDPIWERSGHTQRGRDGCRVPIPWSGAEPPFGFGPPGTPTVPWLPMPEGWRDRTVEAQLADESSMLALYRRALAVRRELPGLGDGPMRWLDGAEVFGSVSGSGSGTVSAEDLGRDLLVFERGPGVVVTVNLGAEPVTLPVPGDLLVASGPVPAADDGSVLLPPDTAAWWRAERHGAGHV